MSLTTTGTINTELVDTGKVDTATGDSNVDAIPPIPPIPASLSIISGTVIGIAVFFVILGIMSFVLSIIGIIVCNERHDMVGLMVANIVALFFPPIGIITGPIAISRKSRHPKKVYIYSK